MSDDEQGYAPAVYLEPVEENNAEKDVYPEDSTNEGMCVCVNHASQHAVLHRIVIASLNCHEVCMHPLVHLESWHDLVLGT